MGFAAASAAAAASPGAGAVATTEAAPPCASNGEAVAAPSSLHAALLAAAAAAAARDSTPIPDQGICPPAGQGVVPFRPAAIKAGVTGPGTTSFLSGVSAQAGGAGPLPAEAPAGGASAEYSLQGLWTILESSARIIASGTVGWRGYVAAEACAAIAGCGASAVAAAPSGAAEAMMAAAAAAAACGGASPLPVFGRPPV